MENGAEVRPKKQTRGEPERLLLRLSQALVAPVYWTGGRRVSEQKALLAAKSCNWKPAMIDLFRDIIILARDTGMRNGRELCRIRTENLCR